jgi:hypothetical protein
MAKIILTRVSFSNQQCIQIQPDGYVDAHLLCRIAAK